MVATTPRRPRPETRRRSDSFLLVFVLDRTGSMSQCLSSTVAGFNEFLHAQQREKAGSAAMSLVQFDQHGDEPVCQVRYTATPLSAVADLGSRRNPYLPRGTTPLFDAVGQTIAATDAEAGDYDHVLFIIQTDGLENASREYTQRMVFEMVGERRRRGWDFVFLGADIDAYELGESLNVPVANTMGYGSAKQTQAAFAGLSRSTTRYRRTEGRSRGATDALPEAPSAPPATPGPDWRGRPAGLSAR